MFNQNMIQVNREQCQKIGALLKPIHFRASFYQRPYIFFPLDPETRARIFLFSLAICHQTHTLWSEKKNLKGWELLEEVYLNLAKERSPLIDIKLLSTMTVPALVEQLKPIFSDDGIPERCTLDRLEERARFIIDIAQHVQEKYDGQLMQMLMQGNGRVDQLYQLLNQFEACADPMKKKSTCFIKFCLEAGILEVKDPEHLIPIMDYHMQRVLLRSGCVEILDEKLKQELWDRQILASDQEIRQACVDAIRLLAEHSGHPVLQMNDFLWPLGRSCCAEKPLCVEGACSKKPCTFNQVAELPEHKQCVFAGTCKGSLSADYRKFWQPIVETNYY